MFPLILLLIFIIASLVLSVYFNNLSYRRFRQNLIDELREEVQASSCDMCKTCYYKKRCEELEKED